MLQRCEETNTTLVPSLLDKEQESQKGEVMCPRSYGYWFNDTQTHRGLSRGLLDQRERTPEPSIARGGKNRASDREGEVATCREGSSCPRLIPLQPLSQADHLNGQPVFPNSIISAPAGEVQGPLAVKHAVLHLSNISRFGREDVFCIAFHPVRTKGNH